MLKGQLRFAVQQKHPSHGAVSIRPVRWHRAVTPLSGERLWPTASEQQVNRNSGVSFYELRPNRNSLVFTKGGFL